MNPFQILGLENDASAADAKRAFRRLAMHWHPDRNPTREAEEQFKRLKAAYELILDPDRLAEWQASRDASPDAAGAAATGSAEVGIELSLEEAARGCTRTIAIAREASCPTCAGSGREQHACSVACPACGGIGRIRGERGGNRHCPDCQGRGYVRTTPCADCAGRGHRQATHELRIRIPPGTLPGEQLRVPRQRHGEARDLFLKVAVRPHRHFRLEGRDLRCEVPVGIYRLLAGGRLTVPTLDGPQEITLAPLAGPPEEIRLAGKGFPGRRGHGHGDLKLALRAVYPRRLGERESRLLDALQAAMDEDAAELAAWRDGLGTSGRG